MSVIQVVQHKLQVDHIGVATAYILQVIVMSLSILVATAICGYDRSESGRKAIDNRGSNTARRCAARYNSRINAVLH